MTNLEMIAMIDTMMIELRNANAIGFILDPFNEESDDSRMEFHASPLFELGIKKCKLNETQGDTPCMIYLCLSFAFDSDDTYEDAKNEIDRNRFKIFEQLEIMLINTMGELKNEDACNFRYQMDLYSNHMPKTIDFECEILGLL